MNKALHINFELKFISEKQMKCQPCTADEKRNKCHLGLVIPHTTYYSVRHNESYVQTFLSFCDRVNRLLYLSIAMWISGKFPV